MLNNAQKHSNTLRCMGGVSLKLHLNIFHIEYEESSYHL